MRFRTRLVVNLKDLEHNVGQLQKRAPNKKIIFMVKSNGYGHGLIPIVHYACEQLQIREFGCATLGEGLILRKNLPGKDFDTYIFSDIEIDQERDFRVYKNQRLIPVVSSMHTLQLYLASLNTHKIPLCLKFDTGMNRLGIKFEELENVLVELKKYKVKKIHHLLSHFASSSNEIAIDEHTQRQYQLFKQIKEKFTQFNFEIAATSIANSGAIIQNFGVNEESHIRPGLMLYGPSSLTSTLKQQFPWNGKNISTLETHVLQVKQVKKGEYIGYNSIACDREGTLVYVGVGYGDGIDNRFRFWKVGFKNFVGEVFGRVSMDMLCLFFPVEIYGKIHQGEKILIWNSDTEHLLRMADHIGSIPYEILCGLSERVPRVYQENEGP